MTHYRLFQDGLMCGAERTSTNWTIWASSVTCPVCRQGLGLLP